MNIYCFDLFYSCFRTKKYQEEKEAQAKAPLLGQPEALQLESLSRDVSTEVQRFLEQRGDSAKFFQAPDKSLEELTEDMRKKSTALNTKLIAEASGKKQDPEDLAQARSAYMDAVSLLEQKKSMRPR